MPNPRTFYDQGAKAVYSANSFFFGRHAVSGENAPLTVTIEASPDPNRNAFDYVHWSYDANPTGGVLTITDGEVTETIYITSAGPGFLPFGGAAFELEADVVITLTAGGAGINSSLAVIGARAT